MQKGKTSPVTKVIYTLVLFIVAIALVIGTVNLMEWEQRRRQIKELEEQKEALEEQGET